MLVAPLAYSKATIYSQISIPYFCRGLQGKKHPASQWKRGVKLFRLGNRRNGAVGRLGGVQRTTLTIGQLLQLGEVLDGADHLAHVAVLVVVPGHDLIWRRKRRQIKGFRTFCRPFFPLKSRWFIVPRPTGLPNYKQSLSYLNALCQCGGLLNQSRSVAAAARFIHTSFVSLPAFPRTPF